MLAKINLYAAILLDIKFRTPQLKLTNKTIIIVDPLWQGHHLTYIKLFTQIILQQNHFVIVLCPKPSEVYSLIEKIMPDKVSQLRVDLLKESWSFPIKILGMGALYPTLSRWWLTIIAIQKAKQKSDVNPDLIFFSWLDGYIYLGHSVWVCRLIYKLVDLIFPYQWIGLFFHVQAKNRDSQSSISKPDVYKILRSKKCEAIAVLDEVNELNLKYLGKKVVVFPDITDDAPVDETFDIAQKVRKASDGKKVIGLLGYLEKRKGILSLIEIAQKSIQRPWFFLFAGVLAKDTFSSDEINMIKQFVNSNPLNCLFYFDRIPKESQFNALVQRCDILYAVYKNFPSSSNILTKAAIFKKLVLVSSGYCMGNRVKEFNLGISVDEEDIIEQINSLELLLDQERFYQHPKFEEYKKLHSVDRLDKVLRSIL